MLINYETLWRMFVIYNINNNSTSVWLKDNQTNKFYYSHNTNQEKYTNVYFTPKSEPLTVSTDTHSILLYMDT